MIDLKAFELHYGSVKVHLHSQFHFEFRLGGGAHHIR
jgi:hypothetical protein